jgi:transposase
MTRIGGMKRKKNLHVVFKPYTMGQLQLPTDLDDLIPANHLVRVVHEAIEKMDLDVLLKRYKGGGTSSYHPRMMLKVLVYAYSQRIYSSRQIAKALRENIHFMWISGNSKPDFRTINRFRGQVMRGIIEQVFGSVLEILIEEGYVKLEHYFLDGTKIEANANRYSWVWAKSSRNYQRKLQENVKKLLEEIEQANEEEDEEYGDRDLEEMGEDGPIDAEKLEKKMRELNERLREDPDDKKLAKAVKKMEKDYLPRQKKYEEQEKIFQGRNSYSKTDPAATFMRMKEDHMKNGQLKPGYNVQIGTENQFVVGFSVHQRPGDSGCLIPHLEGLKEQLGQLPRNVIADAGYGSEENYVFLDEEGVEAYVKYTSFHLEQKKRRKDRFRAASFSYDESRDEFICPADRRLTYQHTRPYQTENGFQTELRVYECVDCRGCAMKSQCTRSKGNRRIRTSFRWRDLQQKAAQNLTSDHGLRLRSKRPVEAESVFARLKQNWGFRRFLMRGLEKVEVEWGLLCIAHNLAKVAAA